MMVFNSKNPLETITNLLLLKKDDVGFSLFTHFCYFLFCFLMMLWLSPFHSNSLGRWGACVEE